MIEKSSKSAFNLEHRHKGRAFTHCKTRLPGDTARKGLYHRTRPGQGPLVYMFSPAADPDEEVYLVSQRDIRGRLREMEEQVTRSIDAANEPEALLQRAYAPLLAVTFWDRPASSPPPGIY